MKNWIIKHWVLNYDSKVFGTTFRHLRVVNTLVPLFLFAGLFNLFTEGFGVWDAVVFIPFFAIFFSGKFIDWKHEDLDWEQKYQMLQRKGLHRKEYRERWEGKYKGSEKFVEAWRFFFPLVCIVIALLIYAIFGSAEVGFDELRGF